MRTFSAANGGQRLLQGGLYRGDKADDALTALRTKARSKRKPGARSCSPPAPGMPNAGTVIHADLPKKSIAGTLPAHPQMWQRGDDAAHLPLHVRTSRSTGAAPAVTQRPPVRATQIARLPQSVVLDGELVSMSPDGRDARYSGGAATIQRLVVFDLRNGHGAPPADSYAARCATLDPLLATRTDQDAVVLVPTARTVAEKTPMGAQCLNDAWEGIVVYDATAPLPTMARLLVFGRSSQRWWSMRWSWATVAVWVALLAL